jgi:hypothetical protein
MEDGESCFLNGFDTADFYSSSHGETFFEIPGDNSPSSGSLGVNVFKIP